MPDLFPEALALVLPLSAVAVLRPVKRFKRKVRGWHLRAARIDTIQASEGPVRVGVDHRNWVRLYPNPGYRLGGWHQCRRTHPKRIRWEGGE